MITGPSLGASWPGAYYNTGTALAEEPEPPAASATPSGGSYAVTRADTDLTGLYRKVQYGVDAPRFPGSRQEFVDGEWRSLDAGLEEVGTPPKREAPTFEPPVPWTPEADEEDAEPVIEPKQGQESLGVALPKPVERPSPRPRRKRTPKPVESDDDAITALLALMGGMW